MQINWFLKYKSKYKADSIILRLLERPDICEIFLLLFSQSLRQLLRGVLQAANILILFFDFTRIIYSIIYVFFKFLCLIIYQQHFIMRANCEFAIQQNCERCRKIAKWKRSRVHFVRSEANLEPWVSKWYAAIFTRSSMSSIWFPSSSGLSGFLQRKKNMC